MAALWPNGSRLVDVAELAWLVYKVLAVRVDTGECWHAVDVTCGEPDERTLCGRQVSSMRPMGVGETVRVCKECSTQLDDRIDAEMRRSPKAVTK